MIIWILLSKEIDYLREQKPRRNDRRALLKMEFPGEASILQCPCFLSLKARTTDKFLTLGGRKKFVSHLPLFCHCVLVEIQT